MRPWLKVNTVQIRCASNEPVRDMYDLTILLDLIGNMVQIANYMLSI